MHYCIIHECHLNLLAHPPFLSPKKYIPLNYKNNFLQAFIIILAILKEACRGGDGVLAKTPSQQFLHWLCPSISWVQSLLIEKCLQNKTACFCCWTFAILCMRCNISAMVLHLFEKDLAPKTLAEWEVMGYSCLSYHLLWCVCCVTITEHHLCNFSQEMCSWGQTVQKCIGKL